MREWRFGFGLGSYGSALGGPIYHNLKVIIIVMIIIITIGGGAAAASSIAAMQQNGRIIKW